MWGLAGEARAGVWGSGRETGPPNYHDGKVELTRRMPIKKCLSGRGGFEFGSEALGLVLGSRARVMPDPGEGCRV